VFERLRLDGPTSDPITLAPAALPGGVTATPIDLQVQLDDQVVAVAKSDDGSSWQVTPPSGRTYTQVILRYRLQNALQVIKDAAPGRAAGVVAPLTASISQARSHPVQVRVDGSHVLGVSCPTAITGAVCGTRNQAGWTATLPDGVRPVVILNLDLSH
jgi:hypothetical protein